jgi:hypothetical protein
MTNMRVVFLPVQCKLGGKLSFSITHFKIIKTVKGHVLSGRMDKRQEESLNIISFTFISI